jgi:quercetin dioxygenase-like cupin family protein
MNVKSYPIHTHKSGRGFTGFDFDNIKLPDGFQVKEKICFYFPPDDYGGNHSHPRTEAFIAIGDMEISWEENGEIHTEHMFENEAPKIYIIPPHVPHIIRNLSVSQFGILLEYADGPQTEVKKANFPV